MTLPSFWPYLSEEEREDYRDYVSLRVEDEEEGEES